MKSFIVAALLVAAVAGQTTMDIMKLNKEKSLLTKFDRPIESELLLKKLGYPVDKTLMTFGDNYDLPLYLQDELLDKKVLQLEEIMVHPLFREYINLPLFRQFWTYPAFQKFVTSQLFQRFWTVQEFKQYFVNPVLFYKYIYPIVNLFKTDITIPTTTTWGQDLIKSDMIVNKNVFPFVTGYERDLNKFYLPTIYNEEQKLKDNLIVKTLLNKVYSHLYNIPEEYIKEKYYTENKIVDPITGEIKYFEDKTVYPFTTLKTTFQDKLVKDVLLKKLLLNKMMKEETLKTVIPEEFILREKMMKMNPMVARMMYGYNKLPIFNKFDTTFDNFDMKKDLIKNELLKKNLFTEELLKKDLFTEELLKDELMKKDLLKEKILLNKIFNKDVNEIDTTFGTYETVPKVTDIYTPMMGVKTFDKKVFPETIIKV